jgi:hypothetical protein
VRHLGHLLVAITLLLALGAPSVVARVPPGDPPDQASPCPAGTYSSTGDDSQGACLPIPAVFASAGCWTLHVPSGTYSVDILAVGAAGDRDGGLGDGISVHAAGILDGDRLRVCVNKNGGSGSIEGGAIVAGGNGGGASGVALGPTFLYPFVIAGGGGGDGDNSGDDGGDAGMPTAEDGISASASGGDGGDNTASAPGSGGTGATAGANGQAGSAYTAAGPGSGGRGGLAYSVGGGGGAGYFGGGGGSGDVNTSGGGGGGTSFCGDAHVSGDLLISGCARTAGAGTQPSAGATTGYARVEITFNAPAECGLGYYSATGDEPCTAASPGHFVDTPGATGQTACSAGYYQPNSAAVMCNAADIAFYVDSTGASSQTACPAGQTTLTTASDSISDCFTAVGPALSLYDRKQAARAALAARLPSNTSVSDAVLANALLRIDRSLATWRWNGESALKPAHGHRVFELERQAVKFLTNPWIDTDVPVDDVIAELLSIDRDLAADAVAASSDTGATQIGNRRLAAGDTFISAGKFGKAIYAYWRAWRAVTQ